MGLDAQDYSGLRISPFWTRVVLVLTRQVDVVLRYAHVLRAPNERVQFCSFEAGDHKIVHESWLTIPFNVFLLIVRQGWFVLKPYDAQQASWRASTVFTYPCSGCQGKV